jgi:hypothetical protein
VRENPQLAQERRDDRVVVAVQLARGGAIAGQRGADQREIDVAAIGAARRLHRDEGRLR